jgi:hypothetical protein
MNLTNGWRRSINRINFTVLVLMAELRYQVHTTQFHRFYCGSTLQMEVGNQTLVMKGSINRLFIEGADNGTSTERDYRL